MTVKEAAERLHLSTKSVYRMIRDGTLPARHLGPKGGRIWIEESDVKAYWERSLEQPTEPVSFDGFKHLRPRAHL